MKTCEKCNTFHDGEYGSGRFCSPGCARSFSTRERREEINQRVSEILKGRPTSEQNREALKSDSTITNRKKTWEKKKDEAINSLPFNELPITYKREAIFREQNGECNSCGLKDWMGEPICLELEHIDGNNQHNERSNLELLCPNCHSQTMTWRGRNRPRKNGQVKVSDRELSVALEEEETIRKALIRVGLSPRGNNYQRAKTLKREILS